MNGLAEHQEGGVRLLVAGESLWLLPERAIWWPDRRTLFIADLHLGKAAHFRKSGLAIPAGVDVTVQQRLEGLIAGFTPSEVYFLGDLFHSAYNAAWEDFESLIRRWPGSRFHLVRGNHDILHAEAYARSGLMIREEALPLGPFCLVHDPDEAPAGEGYVLSGHWHPGIRLQGRGRQRLRVPCYLMGPSRAVLPAFGSFTGTKVVLPGPGDHVYAVAGDKVLHVPSPLS